MNNEQQQQWPQQDQEQALADEEEDEYSYGPPETDLEADTLESSSIRRKSSQLHRDSVEDPLLERRESIKSDSGYRGVRRMTQKIYIVTEDLTIVVAGYTTSGVGSLMMMVLSVMTFGMSYLILRWVPRWRIGLIGKPAPLASCDWMVVEVWGQVETPWLNPC